MSSAGGAPRVLLGVMSNPGKPRMRAQQREWAANFDTQHALSMRFVVGARRYAAIVFVNAHSPSAAAACVLAPPIPFPGLPPRPPHARQELLQGSEATTDVVDRDHRGGSTVRRLPRGRGQGSVAARGRRY
eukprot:scaffold23908_cov36-Tisochrysis_lutea.AAC.1